MAFDKNSKAEPVTGTGHTILGQMGTNAFLDLLVIRPVAIVPPIKRGAVVLGPCFTWAGLERMLREQCPSFYEDISAEARNHYMLHGDFGEVVREISRFDLPDGYCVPELRLQANGDGGTEAKCSLFDSEVVVCSVFGLISASLSYCRFSGDRNEAVARALVLMAVAKQAIVMGLPIYDSRESSEGPDSFEIDF